MGNTKFSLTYFTIRTASWSWSATSSMPHN